MQELLGRALVIRLIFCLAILEVSHLDPSNRQSRVHSVAHEELEQLETLVVVLMLLESHRSEIFWPESDAPKVLACIHVIPHPRRGGVLDLWQLSWPVVHDPFTEKKNMENSTENSVPGSGGPAFPATSGRTFGQITMEGERVSRARNYIFRISFNEGGLEEAAQIFPEEDGWDKFVSFAVWQLEIGGNTHQLHIQGYLECHDKTSMKQLHTLPGLERAHFEPRRGTQKQAIAYCEKEDTRVEGPWRWGVPKAQGARMDLLSVKRDIDRKRPISEIARDPELFESWTRYHRSFKEYQRIITPKRNFKTITILIVGPSGVGKSRFAHYLANVLSDSRGFYKVPKPKNSGCYWDDYAGEDVTFIDEFDGNYMTPTFFNELADRYEHVVPAHGSAGHQFVSKYLIVCSNYLPKFWWKKRNANQLKQTLRRIDATIPLMHYTQNSLLMLAIAAGRRALLGLGVSRSPNFIP